jgi:hypothetical protein
MLYVDESRVLSETDPSTRQIHIGQGTFLEHCRLGAIFLGYDPEIHILPEGEYKISDIGKCPVAHIRLNNPADDKPGMHWYKSIALRATNRTAYHGQWMSEANFTDIVNSLGARFSTFRYVPEQEAREKHFPLLKKGFAVEMETRAKNEESRKWFRLSDRDIQTKVESGSPGVSGNAGNIASLVHPYSVKRLRESSNDHANRSK